MINSYTHKENDYGEAMHNLLFLVCESFILVPLFSLSLCQMFSFPSGPVIACQDLGLNVFVQSLQVVTSFLHISR